MIANLVVATAMVSLTVPFHFWGLLGLTKLMGRHGAAIEGANGVILFAWSTAFLLSVTGRLKSFEHTWPN
jgi:hypothetical protein